MEFNFFFYNYFHISIYNEQIWTICWKGRWRSKKENPCRMPWNWCLSYQVRFTRTQRFISKERAKRSSSNSSNRPIWSTRPTSSARTTRTTRPIWKGQQEVKIIVDNQNKVVCAKECGQCHWNDRLSKYNLWLLTLIPSLLLLSLLI